MNIFFHGASVTAQNKDGSYVSVISDLLKTKSDYTVNKMGYGGTHFNTAGILTFADDIKISQTFVSLIGMLQGLMFLMSAIFHTLLVHLLI
jgi:hypothetical protein